VNSQDIIHNNEAIPHLPPEFPTALYHLYQIRKSS